jgi:hypothetical protein
MNSPAEQKAMVIAIEFIRAEFDDDLAATEWLAKKIAAALEEAELVGYSKATSKRF